MCHLTQEFYYCGCHSSYETVFCPAYLPCRLNNVYHPQSVDSRLVVLKFPCPAHYPVPPTVSSFPASGEQQQHQHQQQEQQEQGQEAVAPYSSPHLWRHNKAGQRAGERATLTQTERWDALWARHLGAVPRLTEGLPSANPFNIDTSGQHACGIFPGNPLNMGW